MEIKQMAERLNSVPVRKKAKRLLAVTLAVLIVNPVTGYGVSAHAQEAETITAFAELSGEVASQQLAVGAEESDIHLPDTLEVTIGVSSADTADDNAEESQPDESVVEEPQTDEPSDGDSTVSGNDTAEQQDEANDAEDATATDSNATPVVDSGAAPTVETTTNSVIHTDTEDTESGSAETTQAVTLKNIEWKIDADTSSSDTFDSSENGDYYTYVPVLPAGYVLADGASLPEISVLIGSARMRTALGATEIPIGDTVTIDGIDYTYQGDISEAGLNLSTAPTEATYYKAGDGYALFTPANGSTPATLVLHGATISSAATNTLYLGADTVIKLEGDSTLTNSTVGSGIGIFAGAADTAMSITIEGSSQASLTVNAHQCTNVGALTLSGGSVTMNGTAYGMLTTGDVMLKDGAKVSLSGGEFGGALQVGMPPMGSGMSGPSPSVTMQGDSTLTTNGDTMIVGGLKVESGSTITIPAGKRFSVLGLNGSAITNSGTIDNNGTVFLPFTLTVEQLTALGIGGEVILIDPNTPGNEYIYVGEKRYLRVELKSSGGFPPAPVKLDLSAALPAEATYYEGNPDTPRTSYILFTPSTEGKPPVLTLHDMDNIGYLMGGIALPDAAITIHLEGVNIIDSITGEGNIAITGDGKLESVISRIGHNATLAIAQTATANVLHKLGATSEAVKYTIYGSYSHTIGVGKNGKLILADGAVLTLEAAFRQTLSFDEGTTLDNHLEIGKGARIVNNSAVILPKGTTPEQIKALPLSGTGLVTVPTAYGDEGEPTAADIYRNDGTRINPINGLDVTIGDHTSKTVGKDGYAWDASTNTLTLGNAALGGEIKLPATVTINTIEPSTIVGGLDAPFGEVLNLTLSGIAPLNIMGGISGSADGDTLTVQGGAKVTAGRISIGGSGGSNGTLSIEGAGTSLTVSEQYSSAVYCQTVNVTDGATLTASSEHGVGVMAMSGNVTVTGGSTLTTNCSYGVYIIDGKLTVDTNSKLITNATIAPFCIVDRTSDKPQNDVLTLAGVPSDTEIASVTGSSAKYWSLVTMGNDLTVSNENSEPVTLTGAVQGQKLDFSKPSPINHSVTVQHDGNGTASATPAYAKQGAEITLTATPKEGYKFKEWQVISGGVTITNNKFTMPDGEVTVKAIFESTSGNNDNGGGNNNNGGNNDNGGGNNNGSGGSSSGDSSSAVTISEKKPDQPVIGSVNASGKVSDNHAVIIITDSMVKTAIEKAQSDAKAQGKTVNGIGAEISLSALGAKSFTIITERAALDRLVSTNVKLFQIVGLPVNICFDQASLKQQQTQGSGDITMTLKPVTVKNIRNAYDIALSTVKDGKTVNITSMGKGTATVSIPYTPGKGEAIGGLYAVSVDAKGNATRIAGSAYDTNSKSMIFAANHFSVYGISYTAPSAKFTDISNHWAKEAIDYVVGRGLLSGTSETTFAPNSAMTRGMLVTALGRLAGVDTKAYATGSFTDVKADSAFRPYIEWAYKKGIVQGTGNGKFEPDRAVTREEIAVIFANYAKATGYTLPVTRTATTYADASGIGSAYKTAVTAMQQAGIMMGGTNNRFNPKASATRAEVSSMLSRYIKLTIDPDTAQGWAKNDAGQYLYYKDGKALAGTQTIDGVKYFFNTDGSLKTGWVKDGGNWRFYSGKTMLVGWWDLGANGSNKTYYFTKDGLMVSGKWLEIDGKWYYFYTDGSLARSTKIDEYEVDENGVRKIK
ncbi:S-layer homology domain-containing protein [Marasmitruncus massiliensis]|uniref:S-layer homology domain-containing protein n=1 Tax=Marasmitruncus massiliensis TaxID=1944642 RepID=UPI0015E11864|nr:S-layer homology domain-containing protein [Marasmitruncus massiliensis]